MTTLKKWFTFTPNKITTKMTRSEKIKAEKKIDVALCKLQDLYYINPKGIESSRISSRLTTALDAIRELQTEVENTQTK